MTAYPGPARSDVMAGSAAIGTPEPAASLETRQYVGWFLSRFPTGKGIGKGTKANLRAGPKQNQHTAGPLSGSKSSPVFNRAVLVAAQLTRIGWVAAH